MVALPLVVEGARERRRLEKLFAAVHSLRRALQRDVRARLRAYWAAPRRLERDAAEWREELGLSREHLERRAYQHLEGSGWLLDHLTRALAMHQADEVWVAVSRHLFGDREGRRSGMPRVGGWWSLRRIAGRARSHTSERKWETFRLFGTLGGHLAAHRHPALPAEVASPAEAARPASWWDYAGPLVLVLNGGARSRSGELVLPVRLPQGAGRWPHLVHFLGAYGQRLHAAVAGSTVLRPGRDATAARQTRSARRRRASARRNAGHCLVPTPVGSLVSPPERHPRNPGSPAFWGGA